MKPAPRISRSRVRLASAAGRAAGSVSHGFTLLEILLAIAIIGMVASVLVGGSMRLLAARPATAEEVFNQAVQEARKTALKTQKDVRLVYRKEQDGRKTFLIVDAAAASPADPASGASADATADAGVLQRIPLPVAATAAAADDVDVSFLSGQKGGSSILLAGVAVQTQTVPYVSFYTDGTCSPFRAQFVRSGSAHTVGIDPWTCAAELTPVDPNAPPTP